MKALTMIGVLVGACALAWFGLLGVLPLVLLAFITGLAIEHIDCNEGLVLFGVCVIIWVLLVWGWRLVS